MGAEPQAWDFAVAPPRSAPGVSSMVGYRALDVPETLHRGMPSSRLTFIVSLDDGVEAAPTAEGLPHAAPCPVVLGGLHLQASHVLQRRGQAGVQLAMHPLAARAVFGVPAAELSVTDFDGTTFLGRWGTELHERLTESTQWAQAFHLVADGLIRRNARVRSASVRPELLHAWHLLERSHGRVPIHALAAAVDLGPRQLGNVFRRELGRSPKQVAGLMRFERATTAIAQSVTASGRADLAEVATAAGYADQSHLSREFTRYAGTSPGRWIAEEFRNLQDGGHAAAAEWAHD